MDHCNDLCTRETTGQCALCEALAERERFVRLWLKGGFLGDGLRAMQRGFSREPEVHKAMVWRSIAAIWHQGQFETIEEVIAPTYVHHTSHTAADGGREVHGPDGVSAFPDLRFILEDLVVEGDKIVARWTCSGTHHGVFRGMAPTGKRVTFTGMTLYRIAQGKIVEQWTVEDGISLYQQLGILGS